MYMWETIQSQNFIKKGSSLCHDLTKRLSRPQTFMWFKQQMRSEQGKDKALAKALPYQTSPAVKKTRLSRGDL